MLKLQSFLIAALLSIAGLSFVQAAPLAQLQHTREQFNQIITSSKATVMLLTSPACDCGQLEQWLEQEASQHPEVRIVKGDAGDWGIEASRLPFLYVVPTSSSVFGLNNYSPKTIDQLNKLVSSISTP